MDCVFLGYAQRSICYRFLVVKSEIPDMHVDTILESRDATFFENMFPMKDMHSIARISSEIFAESSTSVDHSEQPHVEEVLEKDDNESAPTRSKRQRIEKSFGDDFIVYLVDNTPTSIAEAFASPDADDWKEASKLNIVVLIKFCVLLNSILLNLILAMLLCDLVNFS